MTPESQSIFQSISLLMTQGRSAEARMELERLLAMDPEDPEARSLAGDVYAFTGAYAAAYKHYNAAAEIYNRLGRADLGLAVHHKIIELDPSMLDAATQARIRLLQLLVFAEDAIVAGQHEKAVQGFTEAIRAFPNHTITYQRLANLLVRMGRLDEAVANYLTVADAFYAHEFKPKARPYYERALELRPGHAAALDKLLDCLAAEGASGEAPRFIKAAVQAQLQAGNAAAAQGSFERLAPDQRAATSPLAAALLLQRGRHEDAQRMALDLELSRPEISEWFQAMGRFAEERGDKAVAEQYLHWSQGRLGAPKAPAPEPAAVVAAAPPAPPIEEAPIAVPPPVEARPAAKMQLPETEDRQVLQTMGEMCLAEEMFEEAKQVYERLVQVDPNHQPHWDRLNSARAGLGLTPQFPSAKPPRPKESIPVAVAPAGPAAPPVAAVLPASPAAPVAPPAAPAPVAVTPPPAAPPAPAPAAAVPPADLPPASAPAALPSSKAWIKAPSNIFGADLPPLADDAAAAVAASLPEIEPMGVHRRTSSKPSSGAGRPEVEWSDSPYAVGPGETKARGEAPVPAPPVAAPAPPVAAPTPPTVTPKPTGEGEKPEPMKAVEAPPPPPPKPVLEAPKLKAVAPPPLPDSVTHPSLAPLPPLPGAAKAPAASEAPAPAVVQPEPPAPAPVAAAPAPAVAPPVAPAPAPAVTPKPVGEGGKLAPLSPPRIVKVPQPALAVAGAPGITRHAFVVQLGELPPAVSSAVDESDEIIE